MIVTLDDNRRGRDFAVGDLHGCLRPLQSLLNHVAFDRQHDRLIAVGDLIDRGEHSLPCLELLTQDWFYAVRGNHEARALEWCAARERQQPALDLQLMWQIDGGEWFFHLSPQQQRYCQQLMQPMPWAISLQAGQRRYAILHAEVPPEIDDIDTFYRRLRAGDHAVKQACIWGRERYINNLQRPIVGVDYLICGHTPGDPQDALHGNSLDIDFCAFAMASGGALGMLELGQEQLYINSRSGIRQTTLASLAQRH
ncbi:TPA: metallophosphoesterase [Serratia odorifera]|nr:metallophosphoesterase [Serratia odorifera]